MKLVKAKEDKEWYITSLKKWLQKPYSKTVTIHHFHIAYNTMNLFTTPPQK